MKKLWNKWTEIALVKRILVGLVLGAILGLTIPGATGISILGDDRDGISGCCQATFACNHKVKHKIRPPSSSIEI